MKKFVQVTLPGVLAFVGVSGAGIQHTAAAMRSDAGAAASQTREFPSQLLGTWRGSGKLLGMESKTSMTWEQVRGGRFVRLVYKSEMRVPNGSTQTFEGHAYYKALGQAKFRGTWFDSRGSVHPIEAVFEHDALTANWGSKETEQGRTVYRLAGPTSVEVVDSVLGKDGSWREFGRAVLHRE